MEQGISQSLTSSSPLSCAPHYSSYTYSKPPILSYFSLLWIILEEINWTSLQWEQKKEMNLWFQWYPWHRSWVAPLNILQPWVSLLNPLQLGQSHFPPYNTNTQVRIQESVLCLNNFSHLKGIQAGTNQGCIILVLPFLSRVITLQYHSWINSFPQTQHRPNEMTNTTL